MAEDHSSTQQSARGQGSVDSDRPTPPLGEDRRLLRDRRLFRWDARAGIVAAVVAIVGLGVTVFTLFKDNDPPGPKAFDVELTCQEANCVSVGGKITFKVKFAAPVPDGKRALLIHQSPADEALNWVLGGPVSPNENMEWTYSTILGNPEPQAKDRQFKTCVYLMPIADAEKLQERLVRIPLSELPSSKEELDCVDPKRPAG
jgi:hypothetical protein